MTETSFELGCNYWPRRTAMYMWRDLDLGEVREELAHVRDLGFGVVRWFLLAEDFLPGPLEVPTARIDAAVAVARAAADAGLASVPTLVVVNMSGRMWWPRWMRPDGAPPVDPFSDPLALRSQALLCRTVATALTGDRSIRAFDLSNEMDGAALPGSRHAAWLWTAVLAAAVRRGAPAASIQVGAHLPSLVDRSGMRLDDIAESADEDCMHAYPLYCDVARSPLDAELAPFACALTSELAGRGRPALLQELGVCTAPPGTPGTVIDDDFLGRRVPQYLASEDEGAAYYATVLDRLAETGARGAYAWCYADYAPELFDRPPLDTALRERSFGLVRADGTEKPACDVIRRAAPGLRAGPRPSVLDVTADEYHRAPARHFRRLYERWLCEVAR